MALHGVEPVETDAGFWNSPATSRDRSCFTAGGHRSVFAPESDGGWGEIRMRRRFPAWLDPTFAASLGLHDRWQEFNAPEAVADDGVRAEARSRLATGPWSWYFEFSDPGVTRIPVEIRYPFLDVRLVELPPGDAAASMVRGQTPSADGDAWHTAGVGPAAPQVTAGRRSALRASQKALAPIAWIGSSRR